MSPEEAASAIVTQSIIIANLKANLDQHVQIVAGKDARIKELEQKLASSSPPAQNPQV